MINSELQAYLQRFPPEANVEVKVIDERGAGRSVPLKGVEFAFDTTPVALTPQNIGWADMMKEKIKVLLVAEAKP